jgi:hypothetical protein
LSLDPFDRHPTVRLGTGSDEDLADSPAGGGSPTLTLFLRIHDEDDQGLSPNLKGFARDNRIRLLFSEAEPDTGEQAALEETLGIFQAHQNGKVTAGHARPRDDVFDFGLKGLFGETVHFDPRE